MVYHCSGQRTPRRNMCSRICRLRYRFLRRCQKRRAFFYDVSLHDLDSLGGDLAGANDINDAGVVVCSSVTKEKQSHAFVHDGTKMYDLNDLLNQQ